MNDSNEASELTRKELQKKLDDANSRATDVESELAKANDEVTELKTELNNARSKLKRHKRSWPRREHDFLLSGKFFFRACLL